MKQKNYEIKCIKSKKNIKTSIEEDDFDVVVLDHRSSELDDLVFYENCKNQKNNGVFFIIFTDRNKDDIKKELLKLGLDKDMFRVKDRSYPFKFLPDMIEREYKIFKQNKKIDKLEQKNRWEKERRTLLDNLQGVALILKKNSREIIFSNQTAKEEGAFPGETCYRTIADREDPCPFCKAPEVWKNDERRDIRVEYRGKYYYGIWIPYTEDLYVHYIYDITEQKEKEKKINERKEKIKELHKISKKLLASKSEEDIFKQAVAAVKNVLDFDKCCFAKVEDDQFIVKEKSEDLLKGDYLERPIDEGGLDTMTYLDQESFLVNNIEENKFAKPVNGSYKSAISIPIGEYGVFQAVSKEKEYFSEEDLTMTKLLINDVASALKRLEMRKKEKFFHSVLRHDVGNKNLLAKGYIQILKDHDLSEEVEKTLKKTETAIDNSLELIEKVKKLRQTEYEDTKIIDILSIIADAEKEVFNRSYDVEIETSIVNNLDSNKEVKAGSMLKDVLANILENSVKYSDCEKIKIGLRSSRDGENVICSIEDDGKGIPDEKKEKIFQKGYTTDQSRGSGLGLYLAKKLIEVYGGEIKVKDSELGGAKFELSLKRN